MTNPSVLIDELVARILLADRSGTLLLLTGADKQTIADSRDLILALLGFHLEDSQVIKTLGETSPTSGPESWVMQTQASPADAFVLVVKPGESSLSVRSFGRRLNGEREHLRGLTGPLLLFITEQDEQTLRDVAPDFFTWVAQGYELPPLGELRAHATAVLPPSPTQTVVDNTPPIRYLHLSDIHFRVGEAAKYDRTKVLKGLLSTLKSERESAPLDLIFFAGDLSYSGQSAEYKDAVDFLNLLIATTGVDPSRVFIVPGNHDANRSIGRWLLRTLDSKKPNENEDATDFFVREENRSTHLLKFRAYREALSPILGISHPLGLQVGEKAVEIVDIRGTKIAVASFNSAWFSVAEDDIEKLWIGEANVDRAAQRIAAEEGGVEVAIALMHHPTEFLSEGEREAIEKHLERSFDLVLRGHLHKDKAKSIQTSRGQYIELASPAAYQGSQWPNGCLIGEIHFSSRTLRVQPFKFGSGADPWTLDPSVFPDNKADSYCHSFALRERRIRGAVRNALSSTTPLDIAQIAKYAVPFGNLSAAFDIKELLGVIDSEGARLPSSLRNKLVRQLATLIPIPPNGTTPTCRREMFEALLGRLVSYWSKNRGVWIEDLGAHAVTYKLFAYAFFERQAGQPMQFDARSETDTINLLVGSENVRPDERVAVEINHTSAKHALSKLNRFMNATGLSLGTVLWFQPDRPIEERRVELQSNTPDRAIWLVYL